MINHNKQTNLCHIPAPYKMSGYISSCLAIHNATYIMPRHSGSLCSVYKIYTKQCKEKTLLKLEAQPTEPVSLT